MSLSPSVDVEVVHGVFHRESSHSEGGWGRDSAIPSFKTLLEPSDTPNRTSPRKSNEDSTDNVSKSVGDGEFGNGALLFSREGLAPIDQTTGTSGPSTVGSVVNTKKAY